MPLNSWQVQEGIGFIICHLCLVGVHTDLSYGVNTFPNYVISGMFFLLWYYVWFGTGPRLSPRYAGIIS